MSFAKAVIYGNLTSDPEVKTVTGGKTVAVFTVAVNEFTGGRAAGGGPPPASFFECEAWEGKAEAISKHFHKGRPIIVHARIRMDSWLDAQTQTRRYKHRYVVDSFDFVGTREREPGHSQGELPLEGAKPTTALGGGLARPRPMPTPAPQHDINDEDVPF